MSTFIAFGHHASLHARGKKIRVFIATAGEFATYEFTSTDSGNFIAAALIEPRVAHLLDDVGAVFEFHARNIGLPVLTRIGP